jgi:hypothetical protein
MKRSFLFLSLVVLIAWVALARGDDARAHSVSLLRSALPTVGSVIDASTADRFASVIPGGLIFAIKHGLTVRVIPIQRIDWPTTYQQATEKHSGQVALDADDTVHNYVAGLPFPLIDASDPTAAVKIAYDWRWGPFIPNEVSLNTTQKTKAYSIDPTNPVALISDDSRRDYRNENECDQTTFVHYLSGLDAPDGQVDRSVVFKQHGDHCGPEHAAVIGVEYLDPARDDDVWFYIPTTRRWHRTFMRGGYPHQSCSYSCVQFNWEYAPPKTEAYAYRLIGKQPLLACVDAEDPGSGLKGNGDSARFAELNCQLRQAYALDMRPRVRTSDGIIPAKIFVDTETYLYLGAEFSRDNMPDFDVPLWSRQATPDGDTLMVLANDFYIPGDKSDFFLSLNLMPGSLALGDQVPENLFNPKAQQ